MTDSQRKRDDDEMARQWVQNFAIQIPGSLDFTEAKKCFLAGLAHCRETEVKERNDYITKATELWVTKLESLEEQLRVAVDALRKAKSRYWERCYDGNGNTRALTLNEFDAEVDCALQKIEAMKGDK